MKKSLSLLFLAASFTLAFGCQPPPDPEHETEALEEAALLSEDGPESLPFRLAESDWCVVQANGLAFDPRSAVTITYLREGYALLKSIRAPGGTQATIEEGAAASWALEGDLLTYRDLLSGEESVKRLSLTEFEASPAPDSLWSLAVAEGPQTCLRAEDPADASRAEIHCPCDMYRIWDRHETNAP